MAYDANDIHAFSEPATLRIAWGCFEEFARKPNADDARTEFYLIHDNKSVESVGKLFLEKCREAGLLVLNMDHYMYRSLMFVVVQTFEIMKSMGLVIPAVSSANLHHGSRYGVFHFTSEGLRYFREGYVCLDDPGHLAEVLQNLKERHSQVSDGQIELLVEAQKCMRTGCYRAAMVLIGVANEDICIGLLDDLASYPKPPKKASALWNDWAQAVSEERRFAERWKPGLRVLGELKEKLRASGRGEEWWPCWEAIPGSLAALGEAVRIARNAAAHEADRKFTRPEVGLLLAALPTVLETICKIRAFLKKPPSGVVLPPL